jgi:hypothetical protein
MKQAIFFSPSFPYLVSLGATALLFCRGEAAEELHRFASSSPSRDKGLTLARTNSTSSLRDKGEMDADQLRCNGRRDLCDTPFNQVVFAMTHNSYAVASRGFWPQFFNQKRTLTQQLQDGVRGLMLDTHRPKLSLNPWDNRYGPPHLCHLLCSAGRQSLLEGLQEVFRFMEENPHEVLTIIFEDFIRDEQGKLKPPEQRVYATDIKQAMDQAGLTPSVYTYQQKRGWPSLRQMIAANQRLVIISEEQGYGTADGAPYPWYHAMSSLIKETAFSYRSVAELGPDAHFACQAHRGGLAAEGNSLFLLNHWITRLGPVESAASEANSLLLARARECIRVRRAWLTFVATDFYEQGTPSLVETVDRLNDEAQALVNP